jgi:uncharacterized protein (DUF362 family)
VGPVYQEFEKRLAEGKIRWAGRPREEMLDLFLLALEREEIVAIGYRENAITRRLGAMPIPSDVREILRHALIWAWKDEEMHAIYIRGALLRLGGPFLRMKAYTRQVAGGVGGWASSVLMHARWRDAPLSRTLARAVTTAGMLVGSVPAEVRSSLEYGSFKRFCEFNIDAEKTAWLCWHRIRSLAENDSSLPGTLVGDFGRIELDEQRHGALFELFAAAFDDEDRLVGGHDASTLAEEIARIGEEFLPRDRRRRASLDNPLGSGGRVDVVRGSQPSEKHAAFQQLLERSELLSAIDARAERLGKRRAEMAVAIKPTFMLGYDRKDRSCITDPAVLEQLARFLVENGCGAVSALESPNIYDEFYRNRGVGAVADYFGFASPWYRLVDASQDQAEHQFSRGMAQYTVSRTWKDADFRISLGKMRSHPVEIAYLTVGNVEWLGARCDQFLFCERQAQRETAVMMLLDSCPPHFAILEAWNDAADGLVGVMGCPKPKSPLRFYAAVDGLALDIVAARHMGMRDPRESSMLRAAHHWFGAGDLRPIVAGPDDAIEEWKSPYHNEFSAFLSLVSYPVYVLGSGRGALFVPEMDEEAFPPKDSPSLPLRAARSAVRSLIGLRHPRQRVGGQGPQRPAARE